MYRFLDRPAACLPEAYRFLLDAMRRWTQAARGGRCPCRALLQGFVRRGVPDALGDFGIVMATLDADAPAVLRFGLPGATVVTDDEARLLALFAGALEGAAGLTRIAAAAGGEGAAARLAIAAERVALHLARTIIVEEDE